MAQLELIFLEEINSMAKTGLYANIHAKKKRIASGSKETMRKKGNKKRPTALNFREAAKTAKNRGI